MAAESSTASEPVLQYFCDTLRHLVCYPFSIPNLHRMAQELGVHRCWYHAHPKHPHYDIPKRRIAEIQAKCRLVKGRVILSIIEGNPPP